MIQIKKMKKKYHQTKKKKTSNKININKRKL